MAYGNLRYRRYRKSEINCKEQLSVSRTWESVRRAVPTDMQNQVTSVTYFFVYKISKPFWVDCLQMRNDLPVTGLVFIKELHSLVMVTSE